MNELTINDVLDITVRFIREDISKGKTRDEILASWEPEEDE
jgi:hypothetical protein